MMGDDLKCGHCGDRGFRARINVSDMPVWDADDPMRQRFYFLCLKCDKIVFDMTQSEKGRLSVTDWLCQARHELREHGEQFPDGKRYESPAMLSTPAGSRDRGMGATRVHELTPARLWLVIGCSIGIGSLVSVLGFVLLNMS